METWRSTVIQNLQKDCLGVAVHQGIRTGLAWSIVTTTFETVNNYKVATAISAFPKYTSRKITHTEVRDHEGIRPRDHELDSKDLPSK